MQKICNIISLTPRFGGLKGIPVKAKSIQPFLNRDHLTPSILPKTLIDYSFYRKIDVRAGTSQKIIWFMDKGALTGIEPLPHHFYYDRSST
jgi:hypothetical protein